MTLLIRSIFLKQRLQLKHLLQLHSLHGMHYSNLYYMIIDGHNLKRDFTNLDSQYYKHILRKETLVRTRSAISNTNQLHAKIFPLDLYVFSLHL